MAGAPVGHMTRHTELTDHHFHMLHVLYRMTFSLLSGLDPVIAQQNQLFGVVNLNLGPRWEFNAGIGDGFTSGSDHLILKLILGRRFGL